MPTQFNPAFFGNLSAPVPSTSAAEPPPQSTPLEGGELFNSNAAVAEHIGCMAIVKPPQPNSKLVDSNEYIGIELELENTNNHMFHVAVVPFWETLSDGSLKYQGREYRFRAPLAGNDIIKALDNFKEAIVSTGLTPYHDGNRGSTHFHINVSNSTVPELYYQILLSHFIEPALMAMCKRDRRSNSFAVDTNKTKDTMTVLDRIRNGQFMFNDNVWKYRAIGLNSIYSKGSLEYRMFHSTHDMDEVLSWANAVLAIKVASKNFAGKLPDLIKKGLNTSPQTIIDEIFNGIYDFSPWYDKDECSEQLWEFTRMYSYNFRDDLVMSPNVSNFYKKVMGA